MRLGKMLTQYTNLLRDIDCISNALIAFVIVFTCRVIYLIYAGGNAWEAVGPLVTSTSALLVARNIKQLILRNEIQRADDRQQNIVRITHHLMVIIADCRNHVAYLQGKLSQMKTTPALIFVEAAENAIARYDVLLEREIYEYLPGETLSIIRKMSGSVLGLKANASAVSKMTQANPMVTLSSIYPEENKLSEAFETLLNDLDELDIAIRKQRAELVDAPS